MGNMGYCRFRNTFVDLMDCYDNWESVGEDDIEEKSAQDKMLKLCKLIVEDYDW